MRPSGAASHGSKSEIKRVFADGDHVIVHVHPITEKAANAHGMF